MRARGGDVKIPNDPATKENGRISYMPVPFVQASLPHSKKTTNEWVRKNGDYTLTVWSPKDIGLPYGAYPRLIIAWITREVTIKKSPVIHMGDGINEFLRSVGLSEPRGGERGNMAPVIDQCKRLFSSVITCVREDPQNPQRGFVIRKASISDESEIIWTPKSGCTWQSELVLTDKFYGEILRSTVPIDLSVMLALTKSPLAMDIYAWLCHKASTTDRIGAPIPWQSLANQFGCEYAQLKNFRLNFIRQLKKVLTLHDFRVGVDGERGITFYPSRTVIRITNDKRRHKMAAARGIAESQKILDLPMR